MTTSSPSPTRSGALPRAVPVPSGPVLIGAMYVLCVVGAVLTFCGIILFTDQDPYAYQGPVSSIIGISCYGTGSLVVSATLVAWLGRRSTTSRTGTVVALGLAVVTMPFFWCGAPALMGAAAARLGGITQGAPPQSGGVRVAGLVGLTIAVLNVVFNAVSFIVAMTG